MTSNLTSVTLGMRPRSKLSIYSDRSWIHCGGWSHNVILKYAPLSHEMRYSMFCSIQHIEENSEKRDSTSNFKSCGDYSIFIFESYKLASMQNNKVYDV